MTAAGMTEIAASGLGASVPEAKFFHDHVKQWMALDADIKNVRFEFGDDAAGDPAVWIIVAVPHEAAYNRDRIYRIRNATEKLKEEVRASGNRIWPYVRVETE